MKRCRWCGNFVRSSTEPTVRTVHGIIDGVLAWRTFSQILCPIHSKVWSWDTTWNRAPDPDLPVILR
jgi:hypothetical protein